MISRFIFYLVCDMILDRGHGFAATQKNKVRAHSRAKGSAKLSINSVFACYVLFSDDQIREKISDGFL